MPQRNNRRRFLEDSMFATASAVASTAGPSLIAEAAAAAAPRRVRPADRLGVAVVGVRGRGNSHVAAFAARRDTQVLYVCDPDQRVGEKRAREASRRQGGRPVQHLVDFRNALDDPRVDIVTIATPNHWQALAAIWAMQAGKDVYVELPGSHCVLEGRWLADAAKQMNRVCQIGLQCRSSQGLREAMEYLRAGQMGAVRQAQGLSYKQRSTIGPKVEAEPPRDLDYDLWSGPATLAPITRQRFHHDWRWLWEYGGGEIAGPAVHQLDIARWGLGDPSHPERILSFGGRFGEPDSGEAANAQTALFEFNGPRMVFEVRGERNRKRIEQKVGVIFTAEDGYLVVASHSSAVAFNSEGQKTRTFAGRGDHFANFVHAVRQRTPQALTADPLVGHHAGALCHLANISYRLGRKTATDEVRRAINSAGFESFAETTDASLNDYREDGFEEGVTLGALLTFDYQQERFTDAGEVAMANSANALLSREYRAPFVLPPQET